jgi:endonuclease G, mitochondrial
VLAGCKAPVQRQRAAMYTQHSAIEGAQSSPNCLYGMPEKQPGWDFGPTRVLLRADYALEHSSLDKIPLWVCEHVVPAHVAGSAQRATFKPDPDLPKGQRAELADYQGSGYDRGHQAPAADFKYDQQRMDECFYLSNMVPQVGRGFNQSVWRVLEERVRDCVTQRGGAYIITGPLFWDPKEDSEATADGCIEYYAIGPDQVAVPNYLYKIVVSKSAAGDWEAVAFVMENKAYPAESDKEYDFTPYVKSIDWVEQHTGLNLMPLLDTQDPNLARRLESQPASELWPCLKGSQ